MSIITKTECTMKVKVPDYEDFLDNKFHYEKRLVITWKFLGIPVFVYHKFLTGQL